MTKHRKTPNSAELGAELGGRVRALRFARGESLTKTAGHLKVAKSYLSLLERGRASNVGSDLVVRMARHFQCSTDYLLGLSSSVVETGVSADTYFHRVVLALEEATRSPVMKVALDRFLEQAKD